ncbi:MAG: hypothetical protein IJ002_02690 [Clostridia bacterium]|nr:hypothetical protein [Clostridia bacterium]
MSKNNKVVRADSEDKTVKKETVLKLITLILITAGVFAVYRIAMGYTFFEFVLPTYYIVLTVLILVYIIYNRGFARKRITMDMLPAEWSYEEKTEFIEDGKRRLKRSQWMLMLIIAFAFTLAFELLELYVLPWLENLIP